MISLSACNLQVITATHGVEAVAATGSWSVYNNRVACIDIGAATLHRGGATTCEGTGKEFGALR